MELKVTRKYKKNLICDADVFPHSKSIKSHLFEDLN